LDSGLSEIKYYLKPLWDFSPFALEIALPSLVFVRIISDFYPSWSDGSTINNVNYLE
jgi:hypothetical protein